MHVLFSETGKKCYIVWSEMSNLYTKGKQIQREKLNKGIFLQWRYSEFVIGMVVKYIGDWVSCVNWESSRCLTKDRKKHKDLWRLDRPSIILYHHYLSGNSLDPLQTVLDSFNFSTFALQLFWDVTLFQKNKGKGCFILPRSQMDKQFETCKNLKEDRQTD